MPTHSALTNLQSVWMVCIVVGWVMSARGSGTSVLAVVMLKSAEVAMIETVAGGFLLN